MDRASAPVEDGQHAVWERVWREGCEAPARRRRAPARSRRAPLRELLFATTVLAIAIASAAFARSGDVDGGGVSAGAARDEGDPVALGRRNPRSGTSSKETAIEAKRGKSGLVLRTANKAKGGRGLSTSCNNSGTDSDDGCGVFLNKGTGVAATFRTDGAVPFAIGETSNGLVQHLNADRVDGLHASDFLQRSEASSFLGRSEASSFLAAGGKAADAEALDGKDSSAFLGVAAKAADANTFDGKDSIAFARLGGAVFSDGDPAGIGFTSQETSTGVYRVDFPAGSFKTATSCKPPTPIVVAHSDTAVIATVAVGMATCSSVDGSGGFTARTFTHAGAAVSSAFWFMVL